MTRNPPDWPALREDFPILRQKVHGHPLVYLDNAATSQKPRVVLEALDRFYRSDNSNVHRGIHELSRRSTVSFEGARDRTGSFLNARESAEIIFTRGTTESINLVAHAWGDKNIKSGDTILLTQMEHHSNIVPWQLLAARTGAKLAYVPVRGDVGLLDVDELDNLMDSTVKLFAFTHVSNTLGTVNPVTDLCARARSRGIITLVDGAQSVGHRPVDVREIGCDFLAFSGHKVCGPTGIGVLYGHREVLEAMPPFQSAAPTHYNQGTPDGTRPGRVVVATSDFSERSLLDDESIAYHEGIPGHHLQISIAQQLTELPQFRRHLGNSGYVEGWALYAEQLGKEVGFYQDPGSDYGRLSSELFRAVRLVVDTGLHSMGWSRERVVEIFRQSHAVDEPTVQSETDRYIAWPGQALSYKLGQLEFRELRERARRELGARFDIRAFHDEMLNAGVLPLDLLEERTNRWIEAQKQLP